MISKFHMLFINQDPYPNSACACFTQRLYCLDTPLKPHPTGTSAGYSIKNRINLAVRFLLFSQHQPKSATYAISP